MGRLGTFVPRLVALTAVWLLATTALTYAAAQRINTPSAPPAVTTATTAAAPVVNIVPDVRRQAFVFAKGTLGDDGFSWRVEGSVRGFASNTVASQSPAPGTSLVDTGAPLIVLHLARGAAKEGGLPEDVSATPATPIKIAGLAAAAKRLAVRHPRASATAPARRTTAAARSTKPAAAKTRLSPKKKAAATGHAPRGPRWPRNRPPAFTVPGARREPIAEMPLAVRAKLLLDWLRTDPKPTDANVRRWLYQHAWIVAGARMGWWQGEDALQTLLAADRRVWAVWGIGARSAAVARGALAEVRRSS